MGDTLDGMPVQTALTPSITMYITQSLYTALLLNTLLYKTIDVRILWF